MNFDSKSIAGTVIRTLLSFVAGYLVSNGILQAEQAAEIIGAVSVILVGIWGVIQKVRARKAEAEKISLAVLAPPSATVASIEEKHADLKAADQPIAIV